MLFKTFDFLTDIERLILAAHPIFNTDYIVINKQEIEKLIDKIYESMPSDVLEAKKILRDKQINAGTNTNNSDVYNKLKHFEVEIETSFSFMLYSIVNGRKIKNLVDQIYANLPQEIIEARELNK